MPWSVALCLLVIASTASAQTTLPPWNDGQSKAAIVKFAQEVTDRKSKDVPLADRIAVFDNDGTLPATVKDWVRGTKRLVQRAQNKHKPAVCRLGTESTKPPRLPEISGAFAWLRELDLNQRPLGYERVAAMTGTL